MIICGYQGVGKSTYCKSATYFIDLESNNFRRHDGDRPEYWYQV